MSIASSAYPEGSSSVGARISGLIFSIDGLFVYMTNNAPNNSGEISSYSRDPHTGALTKIGTTFTCPGGESVRKLIIHPNGKWLFANADYHIYVFAIASDGTIGNTATSQAASANSLSFTLSNNGNFVYTLEVLQNYNGTNPGTIHSFLFNDETGTLTEQPQFNVSAPGNSFELMVIDDSDFLAVSSSYIFNQTSTGFVSLYSLNTDTGAIPELKNQVATHTKCPFNLYSQNNRVYVLENEQAFLYGAPNPQFCISAFSLNPTTATLNKLTDSPFKTLEGPRAACITKDSFKIFCSVGIQMDPPQRIYTYSMDSTSGSLTVDDSIISANGHPQSIGVDPTEHSLYFSTINNQIQSVLNIENSELPYLTCEKNVSADEIVLQCNIGNGNELSIASVGFIYGLSNNPAYNDSYNASLNDQSFKLCIKPTALQNGKTYYFQAFITTQDGEKIVSSLHSFTPSFAEVSGFSPNPVGIGQSVTITGTFFAPEAEENTVNFSDNCSAIASSASNGSITVEVPEGASSGPVTITANGELGLPSQKLTIQLQPTIADITPVIAGINATITITGTEFYQPSVSFAGENGYINGAVQSTSNDGTRLTVTVPKGAIDGPIRVTCHGIESEASEQSFSVQQVPTITECFPTTVTSGQTINIKGTNFSDTGTLVYFQSSQPAANALTDNPPISAPATHVTSTSLQATVPEGAVSGEVNVVSNGVSAAQPESPHSIEVIYKTTSSGMPGYYYASASNNENTLIAIQNAGNIYRSTDNGKTWSASFTLNARCQFIPKGVRLTAVYFYKSQFYISGYLTKQNSAGATYYDGYLACSTDGTTWNAAQGISAPANIGSPVVLGNTFMAARNYPKTQHNSSENSIYYLANETHKYTTTAYESGFQAGIAAGGNNKIVFTTNAQKVVTFDQTNRAQVMSNSGFPSTGFRGLCWSPFINKFLAVGSSNFTSADGVTWESFTSLPTFSNTGDIATKIASTENMLVIGTLTGCVYATTQSSPSSVDWVQLIQNSPGNRVQITDAYVSGNTVLLFNNHNSCIEVKLV